jgi:hypothetical protein
VVGLLNEIRLSDQRKPPTRANRNHSTAIQTRKLKQTKPTHERYQLVDEAYGNSICLVSPLVLPVLAEFISDWDQPVSPSLQSRLGIVNHRKQAKRNPQSIGFRFRILICVWHDMAEHQQLGIHGDYRRTLASISGSESCASSDRGPHLMIWSVDKSNDDSLVKG